MKFLVVVSAVLACAAAQVPYPGFTAGPYATAYHGYAPAFSYSNYGTPASTAPLNTPVRTALDVFRPNVYSYGYNYPAYSNFYGGFHPTAFAGYQPYAVAAAAVPAAEPVVAAEPAAEVEEVADAGVVVVEAQEEPLKAPANVPIVLRAIIPVFPSDLRSGSDEIVFARPDQVIPVKPVDVKEETDELPAVVAPAFRTAFAPVAPAGIVQATQPRFFAPARAFGGSPVIAF